MGRTKIDDPKTTKIEVRVTPSQKRALKAEAAKRGMKLSRWILFMTLPTE